MTTTDSSKNIDSDKNASRFIKIGSLKETDQSIIPRDIYGSRKHSMNTTQCYLLFSSSDPDSANVIERQLPWDKVYGPTDYQRRKSSGSLGDISQVSFGDNNDFNYDNTNRKQQILLSYSIVPQQSTSYMPAFKYFKLNNKDHSICRIIVDIFEGTVHLLNLLSNDICSSEFLKITERLELATNHTFIYDNIIQLPITENIYFLSDSTIQLNGILFDDFKLSTMQFTIGAELTIDLDALPIGLQTYFSGISTCLCARVYQNTPPVRQFLIGLHLNDSNACPKVFALVSMKRRKWAILTETFNGNYTLANFLSNNYLLDMSQKVKLSIELVNKINAIHKRGVKLNCETAFQMDNILFDPETFTCKFCYLEKATFAVPDTYDGTDTNSSSGVSADRIPSRPNSQ
ncbi:hypothetical protein GJ496_001385 [Pomphorhynchus laevis]|nr:hypothetical protein GJ496_001385 [Pomphorhynchus laevis]